MRRALISKLERLEARLKAVRSVRDPIAENIASDLVCNQIREYLRASGIEQSEHEPASWALTVGSCRSSWRPLAMNVDPVLWEVS